MTPACPFCARIERGEYDYADDYNVAFQPLNPVTPGHFLVVPKTHVSNVLAAPNYAGRALKYAGYLANQMDIGSANFITSAGKTATQTVFHLHVHIVPRSEGDGLMLPWTGQETLPPETEAVIEEGRQHPERSRPRPWREASRG